MVPNYGALRFNPHSLRPYYQCQAVINMKYVTHNILLEPVSSAPLVINNSLKGHYFNIYMMYIIEFNRQCPYFFKCMLLCLVISTG